MQQDELQKDWKQARMRQPLRRNPSIANNQIILGHGTVLAKVAPHAGVWIIEAPDDDALAALLSVAYGYEIGVADRPVQLIKQTLWGLLRGRSTEAGDSLNSTGLPILPDEGAERLFQADALLKAGMAAAELLEKMGPAGLRKDYLEQGRQGPGAPNPGWFGHGNGGASSSKETEQIAEIKTSKNTNNKVILLTVYENGIGVHSALYVEKDGKKMLYDPGGGFGRPERGTGDVLYGDDANLDAFIKHHAQSGGRVELDTIKMCQEDNQTLFNRIEGAETSMGGLCAYSVSGVISGLGEAKDIGIYMLPGNLRDRVRSVTKGGGKK